MARLNLLRVKSEPPTIAWMCPVRLSMATSAPWTSGVCSSVDRRRSRRLVELRDLDLDEVADLDEIGRPCVLARPGETLSRRGRRDSGRNAAARRAGAGLPTDSTTAGTMSPTAMGRDQRSSLNVVDVHAVRDRHCASACRKPRRLSIAGSPRSSARLAASCSSASSVVVTERPCW